jgi:cbb3-type cytochrome oxidase subunit 3
MEESLIGIYKGLRLPLLGLSLLFIAWYVYRPRAKKELEQARFNMLDDDVDPELGAWYDAQEKRKNKAKEEAV